MFKTKSTNPNSPEGVVREFLTAIHESDFKKALGLVYFEDQQMRTVMSLFLTMMKR